MYIYKKTTVDNALVSMHRIVRLEVQGEVASVLLYSTDPADEAPKDHFRTYSMPMSALAASPYPQCVTDWLTAPGGVLEGGTVVEGEDLTLEAKQDVLLVQAQVQRDLHIHGGITFQSLGIDTDEVSLRNILGTAQMATLSKLAGQPFTIAWRCADNSMANFDADNFIELAEAVMLHVQACYVRSWELKEEIANATEESIDNIAVDQGWPGS